MTDITESNKMNKKLDVTEIKWYRSNPALEEKDMHLLNQIPYTLPTSYIKLLKISNGGYPEDDVFDFYDESLGFDNAADIGCVCGILGNEARYESLLYYYLNPAEFFPKNLLVFAFPGGGLTCFDYRHNPKSDNPPVVFWSYGAEEDKSISFVAKDFDEFLSMLHPMGDIFEEEAVKKA